MKDVTKESIISSKEQVDSVVGKAVKQGKLRGLSPEEIEVLKFVCMTAMVFDIKLNEEDTE